MSDEVKGKVMKKEPELTYKAVGLYKDDKNPEWMVAVLKFNPVTGEAKVVERINSGGGKDFAVEKFKLVVIEQGLFS